MPLIHWELRPNWVRFVILAFGPLGVFLRMLKRDPRAEPVGHTPSFLHRSAVNAALDLVRSRQNIRSVPLDELESVLADPAHRRPDRVHGSGEIREWLCGGEVLTGVLFVNTNKPTFIDLLNMVDEPVATLPQSPTGAGRSHGRAA